MSEPLRLLLVSRDDVERKPVRGYDIHLRVIFERCIALGLTEEQAQAVRDLAERSIP